MQRGEGTDEGDEATNAFKYILISCQGNLEAEQEAEEAGKGKAAKERQQGAEATPHCGASKRATVLSFLISFFIRFSR